jgi:maltooligosyltrehalose trehalohydrolase
VDPLDHQWGDANWPGLRADQLVIYELHVGTFSLAGTFDGVIEQLPYLRDLGITALELMPLAEFPGRWNWGYDGVDLYAPASVYGGSSGLKRLVDAAHQAGLGLLLDVVYNHFGPDGNYLRLYSDDYFTDRYATAWSSSRPARSS